MSFTWTTITRYTTLLLPAQITEAKYNIEHIYSQESLPAPSWLITPVTGGIISGEHQQLAIRDLRNKLDYALDMNVCSAVNSGTNTGNNAAQCPAADSGHHHPIRYSE